jgi:hypothetical protein
MPEMQEGLPGRGAGPRNTNVGSRYAFPEANPYARLKGPPKIQFGEQGELTRKTIEQAGLKGEERRRALEMVKIQRAYLDIYNSLDFPNDPDGHIVDLSGVHMTQPKVAIAWTLACLGFRQTGPITIKKRHYHGPGIYENAYYYVDSRAPDDAREELRPEHRSDDHHLPPDTRRLAAQRDGDPGQELPDGWHVTPEIIWEDASGNPIPPPAPGTMSAP